MAMMVRLKHVRRTARDRFRVTLDLVDPDRPRWAVGDCTGRVDVADAPRHEAVPRGILKPALGEAVHAYVERLFDAGVVGLVARPPDNAAPERTA